MKIVKLVYLLVCLGTVVLSCEFEEINYQEPIPTALPASEITSSSFLASWNAIEGTEKYTVLVSTSQAFEEASIVEGYPTTVSSTSHQVTGLEANTNYFYQVKLNTAKAEYSTTVSVTTLPLLPPQMHYPKQITPLSFVAQWLSVDGAEGYKLYVAKDANFTTYLEGFQGKLVLDTTALVSGLTVDNDYFYRVKTVRGLSESVFSELMEVSTSSLAKPELSNPSDTSFTSVTINWKAVNGATTYRVFVATDPLVITGILPEYNGKIVVGATSLVVTNINANTTYYYRVQAENEQSTSEVSDVGILSTTRLLVPTARPATNARIDGFQANWDSVANASSYVVDISRNENFTSFVTGYQAKEVVDTLEVVSGLLRNTNYFYRVRSKGFGAVSANSNVVRVTTSSFASPRALEAANLQPTSFRAVWRPVNGADSYRLEVATDANFENPLPAYDNITVNDTLQQVSGLTVNRRYFYRVRALKGGIFSGYSNIIDLTTTNLSVPQNLTVTNQQLTQFTINWSPVTGATGYRVDVGFDPLLESELSGYTNRLVSGPTNTSLVVENLEANRTYYFKVRAENALSTGGSATGSGKTAPIDPPVATAASAVELTSFQANWQSAANAEDYLLDVAIDPDFDDLVAGFNGHEVEDPTLFKVVTGLEPGRTYYYRVRSKGLGATSVYSTTVSVTTTSLPAPVVQAASNQEVYQFTANWQAVAGAESYLLYVATDPLFNNVLGSYNGKAVLGYSHVVTGLDPHTTYYYRLKSKQSNTLSDYSDPAATVDAVVGSGCVITQRQFGSLGREEYDYSASPTVTIKRYDGSNVLISTSEITYSGDRILTVNVTDHVSPSMNEAWSYNYETYNAGEARIKEISVENSASIEIRRIHFSYASPTSSQLITVRYRNLSVTPPTNPIERRQSYAYLSDKIEISDSSATTNGITGRLTLEDKFHTNTLLPPDAALLLFNPIDPGQSVLPFIPDQRPTYYEYDLLGTPKVYTYPYTDVEKGIPTRILTTGGVPEINYTFGNCTF